MNPCHPVTGSTYDHLSTWGPRLSTLFAKPMYGLSLVKHGILKMTQHFVICLFT